LDETGEIARRVKRTQAGLYRSAAAQIKELSKQPDSDERTLLLKKLNALLSHCLKWESDRQIAASINQMRSEEGVPLLPADLDRNPWLFNCLNGTLDLQTGVLHGHRREDLITKLAPVNYDKTATCPLWRAVVSKIMKDRQPLINYLQRVVGYSLTAD